MRIIDTRRIEAAHVNPIRLGRLTVRFCAAAFLAVAPAQAATFYWDGASGSWNSAANWSTDPSAPTPDPSAAPGANDTAVFNITGAANLQSVALDADQSAKKLTVLGSASGGVTLLGGGTDRILSLGNGGIEVFEGAGPVVIGSAAAGQDVTVSLAASQAWTNRSASAVVIQNGIGASGNYALTLNGTNGFRLNGPGTFSGGLTLSSSTVGIGDNAALGTNTFTLNSGTILVEDFPRTLANKVKINSATTYWSGDGALTLTGTGAVPAFAISLNAAPGINIVNTAPMTITGIYSLCDNNGPNNNPQSPTLASGANLTISADIRESNAGNSSNVLNRGAKFVFTGTGANLTLTGTNAFGEGSNNGYSTYVIAQTGSGFNTITVGGPGGPGAAITPFGLSSLYSNSGQGFYLKALENGQILSNNIWMGQSVGNDGGRPIGFTGENDLTLGGRFTLGAGMTLPNLGAGTLTFAGPVHCITNRTLTILGPGATVFSASSVLTGPNNLWGALSKLGSGTLTLAGTSDLLGATSLKGGITILDYTASNASRLTAGTNTVAALVLGGVDLQLKGGSYSQTLGAGGGTTLDVGASRVRRTESGTSTLALGAITRNSGGVIDFESGVASTTTGNTSGILGAGYATAGGADWAAVSNGSIVAYAGYGTFAAPGTDQNVAHTGSVTLASSTAIRTLRLSTSAPGQSLTQASGNLTLNGGGLLFTGADDYAINGNNSSLVYSGGLCVHQYGNGALTLNLRLSGGYLQKTGPGRLVLAVITNSYTTTTYLLDGALSVHADGCLGSSALSFSGGTLETTAGFTTTKAVTLGANGGTLQIDDGSLELAGIVGGYGALRKTGAGTLLLSNTNLYSGPTSVAAGTLKLGSASALGLSATVANRSVSPVTVEAGGTLDLAGQTNHVGNFTLAGGWVADSVGGGRLGAYSFNLQSGRVDVALSDVIIPNASNPSHSINLYKRTAGIATLMATNLYSGTTFVEAGALAVNGALAASPVTVQASGTLCGTGTLARTVNVEGGALAPGASSAAPGTLTLGRHLRLDNSGALQIGIGPAGYGKLVLTNPDAKVLLTDAALSLSLLEGAALGSALTVIDNQGANPVQGTFASLPEGSAFSAGGRHFVITYQGGDGNDVVLTSRSKGTLVTVR